MGLLLLLFIPIAIVAIIFSAGNDSPIPCFTNKINGAEMREEKEQACVERCEGKMKEFYCSSVEIKCICYD